MNRWKSKK